jgi:glucose repression regulatory protein TUP1
MTTSVSGVKSVTYSMTKDYVLSVAVSHDGQWVVSGSKDRGVQFWDSRSAIVQFMLQGHKNSGNLFL